MCCSVERAGLRAGINSGVGGAGKGLGAEAVGSVSSVAVDAVVGGDGAL